jgi:hypothetical protein
MPRLLGRPQTIVQLEGTKVAIGLDPTVKGLEVALKEVCCGCCRKGKKKKFHFMYSKV